jgi:hypothetical protein
VSKNSRPTPTVKGSLAMQIVEHAKTVHKLLLGALKHNEELRRKLVQMSHEAMSDPSRDGDKTGA